MKVTPAKRAIPSSRRHYHLPSRQNPDSWQGWVGDRRGKRSRWEWVFALVMVVALVGAIVFWRMV
ncbi:hypothetical protein OKA05_07280 [Luteolibacter arcticus]|uniref:Uncharacterized protein n=1 Tax=Luteolibacter arcticus TaxID=1581411 RepID=A0ABT3GFG8_9BACT|nr:hypothetical protein [Luteolibacter arcticus]MCW1922350.1 hypothetical protein [Luteolibacter arcticus]